MIVERILPTANTNEHLENIASGPDWQPIEVFIAELEERWFWRAVELELDDFVRSEWRKV